MCIDKKLYWYDKGCGCHKAEKVIRYKYFICGTVRQAIAVGYWMNGIYHEFRTPEHEFIDKRAMWC